MPQDIRNERAKNSEIHLDDATFLDLTQQMKNAYSQVDAALCHTMRMGAHMLETADRIGVKPEHTLKLIQRYNSCFGAMETSFKEMLAVHSCATSIRMQTNQAERGAGCWGLRALTGEMKPELHAVA